MTPQELEGFISASSSPNPTRANWGAIKLERKLVELLPALLDLWRAAEEREAAYKALRESRRDGLDLDVATVARNNDARVAQCAALARLREVRL